MTTVVDRNRRPVEIQTLTVQPRDKRENVLAIDLRVDEIRAIAKFRCLSYTGAVVSLFWMNLLNMRTFAIEYETKHGTAYAIWDVSTRSIHPFIGRVRDFSAPPGPEVEGQHS